MHLAKFPKIPGRISRHCGRMGGRVVKGIRRGLFGGSARDRVHCGHAGSFRDGAAAQRLAHVVVKPQSECDDGKRWIGVTAGWKHRTDRNVETVPRPCTLAKIVARNSG
jgi:hypothetical protein